MEKTQQMVIQKTSLQTVANKSSLSVEGWDCMEMFVETCIRRFGTMNKNDYEVELFHLMMQQNSFKDLTDFQISILLQIPESKVKRMRYESDLRYPQYQDDKAFKAKLANLILQCKFRVHNDRIQFAINDKMLKLYINNLLMGDGRFLDTSFNANIISITAEDLLFILEQLDEKNDGTITKIRESLKEGKKDLPKTIMGALSDLLKNAPKEYIAKATTTQIADDICGFCKALWNAVKNQ